MNARLFRVIVPVRDIERGTAFYSSLFEDAGKRVSKGRHYFQCGPTILVCYDPRSDGDDKEFRSNPDNIYFASDDLDGMYARAQSLGCEWIDEEIETRPWGERSFYARDPFGNPICFVDARTLYLG